MSSEAIQDPNYRVHVKALLEDWFNGQSEPYMFKMGRRNRQTHDAQLALVYGYCAHAHATAKGYLAAVDAGPR
jgi:hypothetical protein